MFLRPPDKQQPRWKRPVYLTAAVIQWMMLGVLLQVLALILFDRDAEPLRFGFLSWQRFAIIAVFGLIGFFLGRVWWRWVYVERRWWQQEPPHA